MRTSFTRWIPPVMGLVLFGAAAFVLERALRQIEFEEVLLQFQAIPFSGLLLATLLTALDYSALSGYDWLALRYAGRRLPYRKSALASFVGYTFSHNIGFPFLTGGSVRYRLYSAAGLSGLEIAKVVGFCAMTFVMGFLTLGGAVFLAEPLTLPPVLHLPFADARPLGVLLLGIAALVFALSLGGRRRVGWRDWILDLPRPTLLAGQVLISSVDWLLAGGVFYVLLPPEAGLSYLTVMGAFFLAQLAGLASNVPGGLGVFEGVMFLFLPPGIPPAALLGSLLAYRVIYYFLPFAVAALCFGAFELLERGHQVGRMARRVNQWLPGIIPQALAFAVFAAGAVLLFSGAGTPVRWRLVVLRELVPLPLLEGAYFLSCLAGAGLILAAKSLHRRLERAWFLAAFLLGAGILLCLLKGVDYEKAFFLALVLMVLAPARSQFYRRVPILGQPFSAGWFVAVAATIGLAFYFVFASRDPADLDPARLMHFSFQADFPRALRGMAGAAALVGAYSLARWVTPRGPRPGPPSPADREQVKKLVAASSRVSVWPAVLNDKLFLFSPNRAGFVMYGESGRSWIALGDPQGDPAEAVELAWRFREECDRHGAWPVFFQVGAENLPLYWDLGLSPQLIGEEAWIDLQALPEGASSVAGEYRFAAPLPAGSPLPFSDLQAASEACLAHRRLRERRFTGGFLDEGYLRETSLGWVEHSGRIVAFANLWPAKAGGEISVDLLRHMPGHGPEVLGFLVTGLARWSRGAGFSRLGLGLCPVEGQEDSVLEPRSRANPLFFAHAENFPDLRTLRRFKAGFRPAWEPAYLACPGGMVLPRVLSHLGELVSQGGRGTALR